MEDLFFRNMERYVYEECTEAEMNLFKQHMEICPQCREEYELACSVKDAMSSMTPIMPPADFSKLVNERLDNELAVPQKRAILKPGYRKYSAVAACIVLAAVLGTEQTDISAPVVLESTTITNKSLPAVPDEEKDNSKADPFIPDLSLPIPSENFEPAPTAVAPGIQSTPAVSVPTESATQKPVPTAQATGLNTPAAPTVSNTSSKPAPPTYPAPVKPSTDSTASTISTPVEQPAVTQPTPAPAVTPPVVEAPASNDNDVYSKIPDHLNPQNQVVLASSVEKTYEISGVTPENIPKKERDLAAEFALLPTTKSGDIVANAATISSMEGVEFKITRSSSTPDDYGLGSGSLFISSADKDIIDELLPKYISTTNKDCYFFTSDNFNLFIQEMEDYGVRYHQRVMTNGEGNVACKIIVS